MPFQQPRETGVLAPRRGRVLFQVGTSGSFLEPSRAAGVPGPPMFLRILDGHGDCFPSHPMTMLIRAHQPLPDRDARLIAGLRRGDPGAVDAFVETYGARICRRIERILGNRADAEEVAQDVLLLVVRRIHLFGARAAFATWVHRIATNAALARLRRRRRNDSRWAAGPSDAVPAHIASAEEEVTRRELQGLLARAIATLPEPYRLPLVLHHLEGLSHDAIAARLGLGLAAVKSRVYRSRILVRRCLAPYIAA